MKRMLSVIFVLFVLVVISGCGDNGYVGYEPANSNIPAPYSHGEVYEENGIYVPVDINRPETTQVYAYGELAVTFNFARRSGWASNQFAVWIEDMDGNHVRTLYATRWTAQGGWRTRPMSIPMWIEAADVPNMARADVDAVAGVTPASGSLTYVWDLTDAQGNRVYAGEFRFIVESGFRWANRAVFSGVVDLSGGDAVVEAGVEFVFEAVDGQPALDEGAAEVGMITGVTGTFERQ